VKEDDEEKGLYHPSHTCLFSKIYMGTVITEWAMQCLPWGNTCSTIETIKEIVNLLNKRSCCQVFTATPS
jgi:hypothetical protein